MNAPNAKVRARHAKVRRALAANDAERRALLSELEFLNSVCPDCEPPRDPDDPPVDPPPGP